MPRVPTHWPRAWDMTRKGSSAPACLLEEGPATGAVVSETDCLILVYTYGFDQTKALLLLLVDSCLQRLTAQSDQRILLIPANPRLTIRSAQRVSTESMMTAQAEPPLGQIGWRRDAGSRATTTAPCQSTRWRKRFDDSLTRRWQRRDKYPGWR